MIEIKNVNFSFGKKEILKNINLHINENEKTIIIGPNGCGKTTLLRIISGYLVPTHGEITIKNKPLNNYKIKEKAKIISMLHQNSKTQFDFSVNETVKMGRYPYISWNGHLMDRDIKITNNSIQIMNLNNLKNNSILEISGGERKRTFIARVYAQDTEIILMDEPTSAMDLKQEIHLMNTIKGDKKKTYIIVLHDLNLASQYADKIILMNRGEIFSTGKAKEVLTKENIYDVYGIYVEIIERNNKPYIIPYLNIDNN